MSTRVTTSEGKAALFDSVTGLPIMTEVFDSADEAEAFMIYTMRIGDIRRLHPNDLARLRAEWEARRTDKE